jgi:radical SAM protein with 4Fe4S-binding SPASM domain
MKFLTKVKKATFLIYKRPKGFIDYCLAFLSALIKKEKAWGRPVHITIEPTNLCNLKCPICETGVGLMNRPKGIMQFNDFKIIIDKIYSHTNSIIFYYMGEPFLNNDAYRMIRYAKDKSIYIVVCTNGHFINTTQLINSGVDEISFQISGITEETHRKYRVGSALTQVLENVRNLANEKKRIKKNLPRIFLGFIVMRHNEHEIEGVYKLAEDLDIDGVRLLEPCVRTLEQGRQFLPNDERYWFYERKAFNKGILRPRRIPFNRCNWIYFSTVILWNGDIVPCCRDVQGANIVGNIFKEDFITIWNGKKYREFRRMIKKQQNALKLCSLCSDFGIPSLYA